MQANWEQYISSFSSSNEMAAKLLSKPEIRQLASRMESLVEWVDAQLVATPTSPFATLVHGDFKAMNLFLPKDCGGPLAADETGRAGEALLIDFQWTGIGFGM